MESAPDHVPLSPSPRESWRAATLASIVWILIGGALSGLAALMDEFRLPQPFDNLAEALVVILPCSVPLVAGVWHRSWKVFALLVAALAVVGAGFLGFIILEMMFFGGGWAR